jgi:hypothetical protein
LFILVVGPTETAVFAAVGVTGAIVGPAAASLVIFTGLAVTVSAAVVATNATSPFPDDRAYGGSNNPAIPCIQYPQHVNSEELSRQQRVSASRDRE